MASEEDALMKLQKFEAAKHAIKYALDNSDTCIRTLAAVLGTMYEGRARPAQFAPSRAGWLLTPRWAWTGLSYHPLPQPRFCCCWS